jgi:hypothetical protein
VQPANADGLAGGIHHQGMGGRIVIGCPLASRGLAPGRPQYRMAQLVITGKFCCRPRRDNFYHISSNFNLTCYLYRQKNNFAPKLNV